MAGYIKVSIQRIWQDREKIGEEIVGIDKEIQKLYEEMQSLGQTWEGPAWQAFQTQVASDVENMQRVGAMLSEYLEHMEYAEKEYYKCENQVEGLVRRI